MAAAIADRVLLSLGDEDGGGGGSQCHDSSKYCLEKSTKDSLACGKCNIFSKDTSHAENDFFRGKRESALILELAEMVCCRSVVLRIDT